MPFLFTQPAQTAVSHQIIISEIAWMGTAVSTNDEWIELLNNTSAPVDLSGWTLTAANGTPTITLSGSIPANGNFLLERTDNSTVPTIAADQIYTGSLGNDGENLTLHDNTNTPIDQVDSSSGWFSGHTDGRVPMVRIDTQADGNNAANWTFAPRCGTPTNSAAQTHSCTLATTTINQPLAYAVYFNERVTTATAVTDEKGEMETAVLTLLNNATTTIDIALYGLDRDSIAAALINAHNRGVTVRVIGDDAESMNEAYQTTYTELTNAGLPLVTDSSSDLQHNKFIVIDSTIVWTGSTNFTDTGLTLNANNSIAITSSELAAAYTTEFEEMWSTSFHTAKSDNTSHIFDYNGTIVESYFSPTDLVDFAVWEAIGNANNSIHFAMFAWTDTMLADRVQAQMNAGVNVQGIWESFSGHAVRDTLCNAGMPIATENFAGRVHHKFAVLDVGGDDPTVILGSYNWTASGAYGNDENTLIIHDASIANAYMNEWNRLWTAVPRTHTCNLFANYLPLIIR